MMLCLGIDTETTGAELFHGCRPFAVSLRFDTGRKLWFDWKVNPVNRWVLYEPDDLYRIKTLLEDTNHRLVFHNAIFDLTALWMAMKDCGIDLDVESLWDRIEDTMLAHHAIDSGGKHGLKDIGIMLGIGDTDQSELREAVQTVRGYAERLGWKIASLQTFPWARKSLKDEKGDGWWVADMFLPAAYIYYLQEREPGQWDDHDWLYLVQRYCEGDTLRTLVAWKSLMLALEQQGLTRHYRRRLKLLPIIFRGRKYGIGLLEHEIPGEMERCKALSEQFRRDAQNILGWDHYNPNSPRDAANAFYEHFQQPINHWTDGGQKGIPQPATDRDAVLEIMQANEPDSPVYRFAVAHLSAKKLAKAVTDLDRYKRAAINGKLYPDTNITGTATLRFSMSNPSMQNIGKDQEAFIEELKHFDVSLRKMFGPSPGREWWAVDGQQLQLVIFAYLCGEQSMIEAIQRGMKFHVFMQEQIFGDKYVRGDDGQKRIAKNVNFGFIFGAQPKKIETTARRPGLWKLLKELFPSAIRYIETNKRKASREGCVYTAGGYKLTLGNDKPHAATNYIIQGTEGEIIQLAMILCEEYLLTHCPDAYIAMNVHDELVFDFPEGEGDAHIASLMMLMEEAGRQLGIPYRVEAKYISKRWSEGIPVEIESDQPERSA